VRRIAELDVPRSRLEADMRALVARQRAAQDFLEAGALTLSPSDRIAFALDARLVAHPSAPVSTDADYPNWTPGGAA
jgi:hypothetical protein